MILETLQLASTTMNDSVRATDDKHAIKNFKNQIIAMNPYVNQLETLLNLINTLKEKEILNKIVSADVKIALQEAVNSCGEKTYNHTLDAGTVHALRNAVELCKAATDSGWRCEAEKLSDNVIASLRSLRGLMSDKNEVDCILDALNKARVCMPVSAKGIDSFLENIAKGRKLVDSLNLNPTVEKFIEKIRNQKATVRDLTPQVLEWLEKNNLLDIIKIRF